MNKSINVTVNTGDSGGGSGGGYSDKTKLVGILLLLFLGGIGAHRLYVGKVGTAILFILTLGGFGIWAIIDLIALITGSFRDSQGKLLK